MLGAATERALGFTPLFLVGRELRDSTYSDFGGKSERQDRCDARSATSCFGLVVNYARGRSEKYLRHSLFATCNASRENSSCCRPGASSR